MGRPRSNASMRNRTPACRPSSSSPSAGPLSAPVHLAQLAVREHPVVEVAPPARDVGRTDQQLDLREDPAQRHAVDGDPAVPGSRAVDVVQPAILRGVGLGKGQGHRGHLPVDVVARAPLRLGGGPRPAGRQRPHALADPDQALLAQGEPGGGEARPRDVGARCGSPPAPPGPCSGRRSSHPCAAAGGRWYRPRPGRCRCGGSSSGSVGPKRDAMAGRSVERQLVDDGGGRERTPGDEDHHRRDRGPQHEPRAGGARHRPGDGARRPGPRTGPSRRGRGARDTPTSREGRRVCGPRLGELGDEARERRDEQQDRGEGQPRDAGEGAVATRDGRPEDGGARHQRPARSWRARPGCPRDRPAGTPAARGRTPPARGRRR